MARNTKGIEPHKFKPGQSGNPKGKVKGTLNVKTQLKRWLETTDNVVLPDGKKVKVTMMDAMILGLVSKARKGDPYAFDVLMNRLEGKVADRVVHSGDPDAPLINEQRHTIDPNDLDTDTLKKVLAARKKPNG